MKFRLDDRALTRTERRLKQKAREIPEKMQEELRVDMPKAGEAWQDQARLLAPEITGNLKRSIKYKVENRGLSLKMYVDPTGLPKWFNSDLSLWIEYGAKGTPAQPYFFVSWQIKKRAIRTRLRRAMKRGAIAGAK